MKLNQTLENKEALSVMTYYKSHLFPHIHSLPHIRVQSIDGENVTYRCGVKGITDLITTRENLFKLINSGNYSLTA